MKKIIASLILSTMVIVSVINCFAKEDINKENLQKAYNELAKGYEGIYKTVSGSMALASVGEKTPIKVEDDVLIYEDKKIDDSKITKRINYELSGNPKFYFEIVIDQNTTLSEIYDMFSDIELPIEGAIGIAVIEGVHPMTAKSFKNYFNASSKIRKFNSISFYDDQLSIGNMTTEDDVRVFKSGETDNFDFLEYAINDEVEIKDELYNFYTYKFTKTKKNDNEYLLKAELVVNLEADLSNVIEADTNLSENTNNSINNSINNNTNNSTNNSVNNAYRIKIAQSNNSTNNTVNNIINNITNNTANNAIKNSTNNAMNNSTANKNAPFVGTNDSVRNLIFMGLVVVMINAIKLKRLDRKKENIEK